MPILHGETDVQTGAVVRVRIGLSRDRVRGLRRSNTPVPNPIDLMALLDTGAECTCIDPSVLSRIALPRKSVGLTNVPGTGGLGFQHAYESQLTVLHPSGDARRDLVVDELSVTLLPLAFAGVDVVIGRDVLIHCVLSYDGTSNSFTLSY